MYLEMHCCATSCRIILVPRFQFTFLNLFSSARQGDSVTNGELVATHVALLPIHCGHGASPGFCAFYFLGSH